MAYTDDDLLRRLNVLKPTSVRLQQGSPAIDVEVSKAQSREDKLADRLQRLRSGTVVASRTTPASSVKPSRPANFASQAVDAAAEASDPIRDWQQDTDEQSLDDLLDELNIERQWKLNSEDSSHVQALLQEAKSVLQPSSEGQSTTGENDSSVKATSLSRRGRGHVKDNEEFEDREDENLADDYVARLLSELATEVQSGAHEDDSETPPLRSGNLDLPSTPTSNLNGSDPNPPSYEDSELESRFSKLGFDLPSAPTTTPAVAKPKVVAKFQTRSNLPTYNDDDIESWCCICNEDGEVRCKGCDDDIYCNRCWRDGHGSGPGQERGHRAVQFVRKKLAAAV